MPKTYLLIAFVSLAIWVIRFVLNNAKKSANAQKGLGQGVQNSAQQGSNYGRVIHQPSTMTPPPPQQLQRPQEAMSLEEFIVYQTEKARQQAALQNANPRSLEQTEMHRRLQDKVEEEVILSRQSHYSEENLVTQYTERHNQGLSLEHHDHQAKGRMEAAYNKSQKGNNAYGARVRGKSRLSLLIGTKDDFKKAILLREVLERRDY
jgi:hypothetical protein